MAQEGGLLAGCYKSQVLLLSPQKPIIQEASSREEHCFTHKSLQSGEKVDLCTETNSADSARKRQFLFFIILFLFLFNTKNILHWGIADQGEGDGSPLQSSCLENPMDGGAWWAAVHGVAKSQTRLSD